jgi:long-chain acyl-CoA synthetase
MFALDPLFATLLVHGDSTQPSIVAVAVLDPLQASPFVKKVLGTAAPPTDLAGLEEQVKDPRVRKEILKGLTKVAKQNRLNGWVLVNLLIVMLTRQIRDDQRIARHCPALRGASTNSHIEGQEVRIKSSLRAEADITGK